MAWNRVNIFTLLCLCSYTTLMNQAVNGAIISEPTSQITFEGKLSIFSCHSNGSLFWQINGELFHHSRADFFRERGFSFFDAFLEGSEVNRTLSIVGSKENNNTIISCVNVNNENVVTVSGNATLTVLGSPSTVSLTRLNSSIFRLTWEASSNPAGFEPDSYTVLVNSNLISTQNGAEMFSIPATNTSYTFDYRVEEDRLPLSGCSQLIFSVYSTNSFGDSAPVDLSWEVPVAPGPIEDTVCVLSLNQDGDTNAYITFTFPRLCEFQRAEYSYSLSLADTNSSPEVTSETKTYDGSDDRELEGQLLSLKLEIGPIYRVRVRAEVTVTGEVFGGSTICIGPDIHKPNVGGLNPDSSGSSLEAGFIAGIVISGLLLLTVLIFNGVLLVYFCIIKPRAKITNHKSRLNPLS